MQGSKSLQKRVREEASDVAAAKKQRAARRERRTRGHAKVLPKGHDPSQDAQEKSFARIATKCVAPAPGARSHPGGYDPARRRP